MGLNANTSRVAGDFELLEIDHRTRGDTQEKITAGGAGE
jgi:hypothetical protein